MHRLRSVTRIATPALLLVLVASGCQLITGSYTVDSFGPICTSLALCCDSLGVTQQGTCVSAVTSEDEAVCAAITLSLPSGACTKSVVTTHDAGKDSGGIIFLPDAHTHHDATSPADVFVQHDDVEGDDDGGDEASSPPDLSGTWTLTGITCDGASQSLTAGVTTTLTFSSGSVEEVTTLAADGCVETTDLTPDEITSTEIMSTGGSDECSSSCTTSDGCAAGSLNAVTLPYSVSDGMLKITNGTDTSSCTGTSLLIFQMED